MRRGRALGGIPEDEGVHEAGGREGQGRGRKGAKTGGGTRRTRGGHEEDARGAKIRGKLARRRGDDSESEGGGSASLTRVKREGKPLEGEPSGQKWVEDGRNGRESDQTARRAHSWLATGEETTVAARTNKKQWTHWCLELRTSRGRVQAPR